MSKQFQKPPLTFDEQLSQLQKRGLEVLDRKKALERLNAISYYRLSAYWYPFRRKISGNVQDEFVAGTEFTDVLTLYEFDRNLRLLVIDAIERIEISVRTQLTYHLAHKYGAFGHTLPSNFHPKFAHAEWLSKQSEEASRSREEFINHFKSKYEGFPNLPIWMLTEIMSLGSLSFLYEGLKHEDKREISGRFNLHHKRLGDWLHKLTYVRNVCAHHSRLWNRELAVRPTKISDDLWSPPITPRNDRIFFILLILRFMLDNAHDSADWVSKCTVLLDPVVQKEGWRLAMGFPKNWKEHPLWVSRVTPVVSHIS